MEFRVRKKRVFLFLFLKTNHMRILKCTFGRWKEGNQTANTETISFMFEDATWERD
jgi:hypothetical protein